MYLWIIVGCAQSYYIQYPSIYPSCISQRPINNNLFGKDLSCSKEGEKDVKESSKYLQPRWCPSGLSHTQKRKLQRLRKQESMEQQVEVEPTKLVATKKFGGRSKLFHHQLEEKQVMADNLLSPLAQKWPMYY